LVEEDDKNSSASRIAAGLPNEILFGSRWAQDVEPLLSMELPDIILDEGKRVLVD
jgi:hypothetical protein